MCEPTQACYKQGQGCGSNKKDPVTHWIFDISPLTLAWSASMSPAADSSSCLRVLQQGSNSVGMAQLSMLGTL